MKKKAYILVSKENGYEDIRTHDKFHVLSIFRTKKFALANKPKGWREGHIWQVVPCTIMYTLPTIKSKK